MREIIKVYTKYDRIPSGLIYPVLKPKSLLMNPMDVFRREPSGMEWGQEVFELVDRAEGKEGVIFVKYRQKEGGVNGD